MTREFRFELFRAIAIATGPRFGSVFVPAVSARVRVLHGQEIEIFFPVWLFFFQRRITETCLDPSRDAGIIDARLVHIVDVFIPGDGTATERTIVDCANERTFASGFYFCFDEVAHGKS